MNGLERLSCLLAAVCHDVDHPGLNQMFLVATNNPLVALYQVIVCSRSKLCLWFFSSVHVSNIN